MKKVEAKKSYAGLGLFACKDFYKGEFIVEYIGAILDNKQYAEYEASGKPDNLYMFEIDDNHTIDGSGLENIARYANHSCKPNAWIGGQHLNKIKFYARYFIAKGEEITIDYGEEYIKEYIKVCKCPNHNTVDNFPSN